MGDLLNSYLQSMGQGASGNIPQEDEQTKKLKMAALQQMLNQQGAQQAGPNINQGKAAQVMKAFQ